MILVTGGAGFIGSHVSLELLQQGHDVIIVDDFNNRYSPTLKEARITHMFSKLERKPVIVRADIRDREALKKLFSQYTIDRVIHLAAWASVLASMQNPHIYTEVNIDGTVNMLEMCRMHGVKNMVFASTSSVYGGKRAMPLSETDSILHPMSPYAASKASGEIMAAAWHAMYNLPIVCLRFFTVYGPWGRPDMAMFQFAEAIMHNQPILMRGQTTKRDFTYIDDIVSGIIAASTIITNGFHVYNLGEHDAVPLPRMINAIENALQKKAIVKEVPLPEGEAVETMANITAAQKDLHYKPKINIEKGAALFADWYLNWYLKNLPS